MERGYIITKQGDDYTLNSVIRTAFAGEAKNFIAGPVKLARLLEILETLEK